MSLDIYLYKKSHVSYDNCKTWEERLEQVYEDNLTHNLTKMSSECELYEPLWKPHRTIKGYNIREEDHELEWEFEDQVTMCAKDIIHLVETGLKELESKPEEYKKYNPSSGWGSYDGLVTFTKEYLKALKTYPESIIKTSR
jgi:hypothetical protein